MPGRIVEIEQQPLEVGHRFSPGKGIDQRPEDQRNDDAHGPAAEEIPGGIVQGKLQVARGDDEQRHAASGNPFEHGHPEGIGGRKYQRPVSAQVERFRGMYCHHQETGRNPQKIKPYFAFHAG